MVRKLVVVFAALLICFGLSACAMKLTTIRPTLITRIEVVNIATGEQAAVDRKVDDETDWLMDDLVFQMEELYKNEGLCAETDEHIYEAKFYLRDKLELRVLINSDGRICKNGRRYVQEKGDDAYRPVNLDQWAKCFQTKEE